MGVELASLGEKNPSRVDDEVMVYRDPRRGVYKKIIVRDGKVLGVILLGDTEAYDHLMRFFVKEVDVPQNRAELLFGAVSGGSFIDAAHLPDGAQICNCNGVSKKEIVDAIVSKQLTSVSAVGEATRAGKGCGSCRGLIAQIIEVTVGKVSHDASEHYYVPGVPLEKSQLIRQIKDRNIRSVSAVFEELAGAKECPVSKPGLASLLKTIWPKDYEDQRDARFVNDRVHANIQKDGTFSVVPRMYAGVTTPEELMRIAQAAVKYKVGMVKLTGGQRIDLLGVRKEDLPHIWKDIGAPSGHAYAKAFRTCKSCVGADFCRVGLGDAIALAKEVERRFQGIEAPHKIKMATAGCPRNCSEAYVKDIGAVAVGEGRWEIYVGGGAGSTVRKGDLLCVVDSHEDVIRYAGRFMQYYREHAKFLERTCGFVERIGIDILKGILVDDLLGIGASLEARMQETVEAYQDPWEEARAPAYKNQFDGPRIVGGPRVVLNT
jgi:nitrite reductase (NADH) large subunit